MQKDTNSKNDKIAPIQHLNIANEVLDSLEDQILESFLEIPDHDLKIYEDETAIPDISNPYSCPYVILY